MTLNINLFSLGFRSCLELSLRQLPFTKSSINQSIMKTLVVKFLILISCAIHFAYPAETTVSEKPRETVTAPIVEHPKKSIVFIAGFDEGDNSYYGNAKSYFQTQGYAVIDSLYSLQEILEWLNDQPLNAATFDEIHLVSHSNPWRGLSLKVVPGGERITEASLKQAVAENVLPRLRAALTEDAKIIFHACGLGSNAALLNKLKTVFTQDGAPSVYASPMFSVFGDRFAPHYLAKTYFAYFPTAYFPGNWMLAGDLAKGYPEAGIDWRKALATKVSDGPGTVYSYQFNVPFEWTFTFERPDQVPALEHPDEIMDWIVERDEAAATLYKLNIPIEKFRWRAQTSGKNLTIKGKTTVMCVLQPLMQPDDPSEYREPDISHPGLFTKL